MKKQLLILLILFLGLNAKSQTTFQSGYFINISGEKINCLIKNLDWKNNPKAFEFKLSEDAESKTATIESVQEFEIYNKAKYIRSIVDIDTSSTVISEFNYEKEPGFKKQQVFLKVLLEGAASLYQYTNGDEKFFYKTTNAEIKELIVKSYFVDVNVIEKNNKFRQQIWNDLQCEGITMEMIEGINYRQSELFNIFKKYNICVNSKYVDYREVRKKGDLFNFSIKPGIEQSSFDIKGASYPTNRDSDFGSKTTFRFGVEVEWVLPFNNNKWSVAIEPTYKYYKSEKRINNINATADFKFIDIPLSVRYYLFLNKESKMFILGGFSHNYPINATLDYHDGEVAEITGGENFLFGLGLNYKKKYSVEFRYNNKRDILASPIWFTNYQSSSIIFGYRIF